MARRRKSAKKRRAKGSSDSSSSFHNSVSSEHMDTDLSLPAEEILVDSLGSSVVQLDEERESRRSRVGSEVVDEGGVNGGDGLLRLPVMADTSMDTVGQPLSDVMDRLNGTLDRGEAWEQEEAAGEKIDEGREQSSETPAQLPFRDDSGGEPPDRVPGEASLSPQAGRPDLLQADPKTGDVCCFASLSPDSAPPCGGSDDSAEPGQSQALSGGHEGEGEAEGEAEHKSDMKITEEDAGGGQEMVKNRFYEEAAELKEEKLSPSKGSHPAEFK